jgi:hypothetical protein
VASKLLSRRRSLGLVLCALGAALALACGTIAYFSRESLFTFDPTPLQLSVVIAPEWRARTPFEIQRSGEYEIQFDCENPADLRPPAYGAWDDALKGTVIRWEVFSGSSRIANGSSQTYPENSYGQFAGNERARSGHEIGRFVAAAGQRYELAVIIESGSARLNEHRPRVNIELNGQELSDISNVDEARELLHRLAVDASYIGGAILAMGLAVQLVARRSAT